MPLFREMCHGRRWMSDSRFFTPMISNDSAGAVFVNDFVKLITGSGFTIVKVRTFFKKV